MSELKNMINLSILLFNWNNLRKLLYVLCLGIPRSERSWTRGSNLLDLGTPSFSLKMKYNSAFMLQYEVRKLFKSKKDIERGSLFRNMA